MLVGFMGSGKSAVAPLLADAVGWRVVDLDLAVEGEAGRTIPELFQRFGEEGFREIEHRVAQRILTEDRLVLASGGGWPCQEGRMEALDLETLSIWLKVSPRTALTRTRMQDLSRPLLDVPDPLSRIADLLERREPYYRRAHWHVDTGRRSPHEVTQLVADRLRTRPGEPLRA